jgi:putative peptidoglycan lipid II flippase
VSQHDSIVRSASIVSIAVLMSRITGLLREVVLARLFGASAAFDAFLLGFRIPNLTRDLFAEGALSSAFVPTFTEYLNKKSKQEAAQLANLVATFIILVVGGLCLFGVIFSPALVTLLASGWTEYPEKFALAVDMTRIMFPFLLLVALAAQAMGILNACNQFGIPALSSVFFNLGSLGIGLTLGFVIGPRIGLEPIEGMAWGVVLGGALQLAVQIPSLHRKGFVFRPQFMWSHPGLRRILSLMGPAILGNAAVQVNVMVNTNFASQIHDPITGPNGPVSWLSYAFRFMQLPLGIFGVAIASATLPAISRSAANENIVEFRRTLSRSLGLVFLLTMPSSVGLAVLGQSIVGAIYQGQQFRPYDTHQTAAALTGYALGLAGYAALKVLVPAFYALHDSRTPMVVSVLSILVNFGVAWTTINVLGMGHVSLALSTSTVALFGFVVLFFAMRSKIRRFEGRLLAQSLAKITFASGVMGGTIFASSRLIHSWMGVNKTAFLLDCGVSIPLGLLVFGAAARLVRVDEMDMALRALPAPLRRFLPARDKIEG